MRQNLIPIDEFTRLLTWKCQARFGSRLLYLGLSGSYARGEATEESDIDIHLILDELALSDLDDYQALLKEMPQGEKACGFVGDAAALAAWPAHEMFQFTMGSRTLFGSLEGIAPAFGEQDIRTSIRIAASGLYHMAGHRYLFEGGDGNDDDLKPAYKTACFALQELWFLKSGQYIPRKKDLAGCFSGLYRAVIERYLHWDANREALSPDELTRLLFDCARQLLQEANPDSPSRPAKGECISQTKRGEK